MRQPTHFWYTVILVTTFACSGAQSAAEPLGNSEVGIRYLDALYAFDFPELGNLLDADAVFEDPTSVVVSPDVAWRFIGRSAILDFVRQSSNGIVDAEYRVLSEFSTGEFVVFNVQYSTIIKGEMLGVPEQVFTVEIPAVTILRIHNGLVISHTDYADYDLMAEQISKQNKE